MITQTKFTSMSSFSEASPVLLKATSTVNSIDFMASVTVWWWNCQITQLSVPNHYQQHSFILWCGELVSYSDNTQKYLSLTILREFYPHLNPGLRAVDLLCYHSKISYQLFPKQFQPSWFSFIHTNAALQFCITNTQWNFPSHLYSSLFRAGHPFQHLCSPHNPYSQWLLLTLWGLVLSPTSPAPFPPL